MNPSAATVTKNEFMSEKGHKGLVREPVIQTFRKT